MKKIIIGALSLFLLLSTLAFDCLVAVKGETEEVGFLIEMSVTFHNNNETENWNFTEKDRAISLFMDNTWQNVQLTNHSHPLEKTTIDEDRNPIAILRFPNTGLKPRENISYAVTYYALSKPRQLPNIKEEDSGNLEEIPVSLKESYCREGDPWQVNDSELRILAQNIAENETNVLTIVKRLVQWIGSIDYQVHEVPWYPNETYAQGKGDCDDQAILLITLCRILGIPSFLQIGCINMPTISPTQDTYWEGHLTTSLKQIGWHGWAMVYVPRLGWLPVDLTFVIGGFNDPLDAIKRAAVTSQKTLQYMNISQTDYVASSREYRDFLKNNDFYVYTEDEMMEASSTNHGEDTLQRLLPWIPFAATVVASVTAAAILVHVWKRKKLKETKTNSDLTFGTWQSTVSFEFYFQQANFC